MLSVGPALGPNRTHRHKRKQNIALRGTVCPHCMPDGHTDEKCKELCERLEEAGTCEYHHRTGTCHIAK